MEVVDVYVFETKDRYGVTVRLSRHTYECHLVYHPEIADYIEEAKTTIEAPDIIKIDEGGCHHHYRGGLGKGQKFRNCYVEVLVHYHPVEDHIEGKVATYWLQRKIRKRGKVRWRRK